MFWGELCRKKEDTEKCKKRQRRDALAEMVRHRRADEETDPKAPSPGTKQAENEQGSSPSRAWQTD